MQSGDSITVLLEVGPQRWQQYCPSSALLRATAASAALDHYSPRPAPTRYSSTFRCVIEPTYLACLAASMHSESPISTFPTGFCNSFLPEEIASVMRYHSDRTPDAGCRVLSPESDGACQWSSGVRRWHFLRTGHWRLQWLSGNTATRSYRIFCCCSPGQRGSFLGSKKRRHCPAGNGVVGETLDYTGVLTV